MSKKPNILVSIVNWNNKDFVLRILASLNEINYDNYEIVVVDNNSQDSSVEQVRKKFPDVKIILNEENLGSTGGFNTGLSYAIDTEKYDYVWLLDNDAEVEKNTLKHMVDYMEGHPEVGMCGCEIFDNHVRDFIVEAGSYVSYLGRLQAVFHRYKNVPLNPLVDFVVACSCLVRMEALKKAGIMDSRYFLFWDDIDYSFQIKKAGYEIGVASSAKAYHKPFIFGERPFNPYFEVRNRLLFSSKYFPWLRRLVSFFGLSRFISKFYFYTLFQGNSFNNQRIFFAVKDFLNNRWGNRIFEKKKNADTKSVALSDCIDNETKVLLLASGNRADIENVIDELSNNVDMRNVDLLLSKYRNGLVSEEYLGKVNRVICEENKLTEVFPIFSLIINYFRFLGRYDLIIDKINDDIHPYHYASNRVILYHDNKFFVSNENLKKSWKIYISFVLGELFTLVVWPILYLKSFKFSKDDFSS